MRNFYALIHFGGPYVSGFLLIGYPDTEAARRAAIRELTTKINHRRKTEPRDEFKKTQRLVEFRRSFLKPWRKTKKGDPVLEMVELPSSMVIHTGHWLGDASESHYICNMPRSGEEQPLGYVHSRLKNELSLS